MKVIFDAAARDDLESIFAWIAQDSQSAAYRMVARLEARIGLLATAGLSRMGRPGLVDGTFEIVERPYIVIYRIDDEREELVVLSIVHGARDRRF